MRRYKRMRSVMVVYDTDIIVRFCVMDTITGEIIKREYTRDYKDIWSEAAMNIFKMTDRFKELKGIMIEKPVTMTIVKVYQADFPKIGGQGMQTEAMVKFEESDKPLKLNAPCITVLVDLLGSETRDWIGKRITLYSEKGVAFGKPFNAVRVLDKLPPQKKIENSTETG